MPSLRQLIVRPMRKVSVLITLALLIALMPSAIAAATSAAQRPPGASTPASVQGPALGVPTGSTDVDFPTGSLVIDMGASPQTFANAMKPYGFVYELLTTYKIPVSWAIKNGKASMGATDFTLTNVIDLSTNTTVASKTFAGGSFIISGDFVGEIPAARLTYWKGQGVKIYSTTTPATGLPQFSLLRSWPRIVLDADSSAVADNYYKNAGIPTTAYRTALPSALTSCDDLFVFPHADPTWSLHHNLINFNNAGGYIFGQCHAASVLENIDDPGDADTAPDMNFLSVDGLVPYGSHSDGTPPYTYSSDWSDPVLQIMNSLDAATENGSEQIYLPKAGGWRPSTKVLTWDPDHPQLYGGSGTDLSPGKAAVTLYGRGFGDSTNGMVMYQAGHDFNKSSGTANVAAQRTFLNFNLLAGVDRSPVATATVPSDPITPGTTIPVSASATGGSGSYTYKWTSSCGGTFADSTAASTTFTAPSVTSSTACTIRVTVTDSCGRVSFDAHSVTVNPPPPPNPSMSMTKTVADSADLDSIGSLGEQLTYTFTVTNTGNVGLTNVTITDAKLGLSGAPCVASLAVGATATCPVKTYTVTQADILSGSVHNTATATATPTSGGGNITAQASATISTPAVPGIAIVKSVADSGDADSLASEGEVLTYSFTVTNTGNVDLTPVTISDPKLGLTDAPCVATLAVGQTKPCTSTFTYTTTAADIGVGAVVNTATAKGTVPGDGTVTGQGSTSITTYPSVSALVLDKAVADSDDANSTADLGETLTYTFTVSNAGNQTLTDVTIYDPMFGPTRFVCAATLGVGQVKTCTRTYVVTVTEIINGSVENSALASGIPPSGPPVTSSDTATIPAPAHPSMSLTKTVRDSNDPDTVGSLGEVLTYSFTVTNTGNVPLTDVTITDPMIPALAGGAPCVATLAVGATTTCPLLPAATHTVTVADTADGLVTNTATGSATPPSGPDVTDRASATMQTPASPGLTVTKSVADSDDADSIASLDEELTYTFTVKNTGNVTLDDVRITDAKLGLTNVPCVAELAPGETTTCPLLPSPQTYTVTATDLEHGSVSNTATVKGSPPSGPDVTDQGSATIPTDQPAIQLIKSVTDSDDADQLGSAGEVLTYSFTVINTGNVPLTDVRITDAKLGLTNALCVPVLAVGATTTCPALAGTTYTVTDADVTAGSVHNTATALGTPPSGSDVSDQGSATMTTMAEPVPEAGLSIEKTVDVVQAAPGEVVTYTLLVKNAGPGPAADVTVTDGLPSGTTFLDASGPCVLVAGSVMCSLGTIAPETSVTITIKVTVDAVSAGDTTHQHQLDFAKEETNVSLLGGDTSTTTATCPTGYFATDGSVRLDSVDQGTGTFADAVVLASRATDDGRGWTGTVRNDSTGQLQAKVNVVCMSERTTSGDNHSHPVVVSDPVVATATFTPGRQDVDLACPTDTYAIAPSFEFTAGEGIVSTHRTTTGWTFSVDTDAPAAGTFGVRCLSTMLGTVDGHAHRLLFQQLADTLTVPAGQVAERKLDCPDGYKGIVAWNDMDPGLVSLGNDPQPISRVFRWFNPTDSDLTARYGLLCVAIRTDGGSGGGPIVNTAAVHTSSPDATTADDRDSASFTVNTTGVTLVAPTASVLTEPGTTKVQVAVRSAGRRVVTFKLVAIHKVAGTSIRPGSLLARTKDQLAKGRTTVRMAAEDAAARALAKGKVTTAKLVVITASGHRATWTIQVHR